MAAHKICRKIEMTQRSNTRIRHEGARRRVLTVAAKQQITPGLLSIHFTCDDFADFISAGADDHVKIFVPGGAVEGGKPPMRDYTPRAFDVAKGTITIDFALHDDPGPTTAWAMAAKVGDELSIGGPRGSVVIPDDYDWYWLIGDETAIPAITRRLAEWPQACVSALIAVTGADEEFALASSPSHDVQWVHRSAMAAGDPAALLDRLATMAFPEGDGFIWIAAEASVTKAVREHVLSRGHPQTAMKASGYWTQGQADTTAKFE
jgi:NADPH-dependent ferric siderophore reductase